MSESGQQQDNIVRFRISSLARDQKGGRTNTQTGRQQGYHHYWVDEQTHRWIDKRWTNKWILGGRTNTQMDRQKVDEQAHQRREKRWTNKRTDTLHKF